MLVIDMAPEQVHRERQEQEVEDDELLLVDEEVAAELSEQVRSMADSMQVVDFMEPSAQVAHGHDFDKGEGIHDIRTAFGVREDFIEDHFPGGVVPNGHEAVHVLLAGKSEFIANSDPIFEDTVDYDESRWSDIASTARAAPIPPARKAQLHGSFA